MRITRIAQVSMFDNYSQHEVGKQLKELSDILDSRPDLLDVVAEDLVKKLGAGVGRRGFSVETIFRCLILKCKLGASYEQLEFHLSDSPTFRAFARLPNGVHPRRATLQAAIRAITPATLQKVHTLSVGKLIEDKIISCDKIRIDSTAVECNIAPPSDSHLLNDGIRVLSRLLAKSRSEIGIKIRFTDERKAAKSLSYRIFLAKKDLKEALYPELLRIARVVEKQAKRGLLAAGPLENKSKKCIKWISCVEHNLDLLSRVIDQTERRVILGEKVDAQSKIFSIFEEHTDIISKGNRDITYGHKINLGSVENGFITSLEIVGGNPKDTDLYISAIEIHKSELNSVPHTVVVDGCYASHENITKGKALGVRQNVFTKTANHSLSDMGIKKKTLNKLKNFRAGIEGNISELKRVFGLRRATWKGLGGFEAFVWSSVLCYNLIREARFNTA